MATPTAKGIRRVSSTDAMLGPAQISNVADDTDGLIDTYVATLASLPGTGNWTGRRIFVLDIGQMRYWDGSAWLGAPTYYSDASSLITMASGWTLNNCQAAMWGHMMSFRANVTKATTAISSTTSGNITNVQIATLDAGLWPIHTVSIWPDNTGILASHYLDTAGGFYIAAIPPNIAVSIGDSLSFSGIWIRDLA